VALELRTGRGIYRLVTAAPPKAEKGSQILTLALERADGIERVVFGCRIDSSLPDSGAEAEQILTTLGPWVERDFEQIREAALKTIRTERKLHEIELNRDRPGPFRVA